MPPMYGAPHSRNRRGLHENVHLLYHDRVGSDVERIR